MGNGFLPLYPKTAGGFPLHFKRDGEESRFSGHKKSGLTQLKSEILIPPSPPF
jgi:hypothetical protein